MNLLNLDLASLEDVDMKTNLQIISFNLETARDHVQKGIQVLP